MPYKTLFGNILEYRADAIVNTVNSFMRGVSNEAEEKFFSAAGEDMRRAMANVKFVQVGKVTVTEGYGLPCRCVIHAVPPKWLTGKSQEFAALHICYKNVFAKAEELGIKTLAMPFLSTDYYHFPWRDAVHIAYSEAEKTEMEIVFITDNESLLEESQKPYVKPAIVSYIGYYRDHAIFELDNGLFARVDIRREIKDVTVIPYFEACYRVGNNPKQAPLPEHEVERLKRLYEENDW